ncbi:MAG: ABC transporter permease [Ktedonobacterales bacterium]|nr:ABC transporter permease [Ktedonobacterales bacterium]
MNALLIFLANPGLWQSTVEQSMLLALPALGGVISERSGVVNIAMEGMMLTGAFFAVVAGIAWGNPLLAVVVAMIAGAMMALIHAFISIRFRADQIVSGIAINIFALGLTNFLKDKFYGTSDVPSLPDGAHLPFVNLPGVNGIPWVGIVSQQNVIVYVAVVLLVGINILLFRSRLGLRIRAVGERPQAADTAGINVYLLRYGAVITSGLLSGLAGAFLAMGIVGTFNTGMTAGKGYIALAAMIFGRWTPLGALVGCLVFGFGNAVSARILTGSSLLWGMIPYLLTIIVLAGLVGRSSPPAADGIPYEPGVE